MSNTTRPANRLARETSPYLLQHAHNPVDWYPWGEEAFARARDEDKPILLSVGYATCHWCHVMERESFEDPSIAALLADGFVAIKVDREELPDVDHVYMSALQALTGHGGWPMNMFLTPALAPFHGGSYFPPRPRHGLPAFADVLRGVRAAWTTRRADVEQQAQTLLDHLRSGLPPPTGQPADGLHDRAITELQRRFDRAHGGFGSAPKFPQAPLLVYLLALAARGDERARAMLLDTLRAMAGGGVYDHVGGGFARYSTDARWQVPHFEKMLYDNAQLVRVYVGAYRLSGDDRLRFVAEDTLAWLQREMHPAAAPAAFSTAQDADAEGVEGRFHVWTLAELRAALGADADAAAQLYGATEAGNWEEGRNVLARRSADAVRERLGLSDERFAAWERSVRQRLYAARATRVWPLTDDKVLADVNAMACRALAEAGRLLGRAEYVAAARASARFLLDTMAAGGRLRHAWCNGVLRKESFLADHAQTGLALLELHAADADPQWLRAAHDLCAAMIDSFHVAGDGFYDGEAGPLPLRARDLYDGAVPSATAAACELLLRLAAVFARPEWADLAQQTLDRQAALLDHPTAAPALLFAQLLNTDGAELALPCADGDSPLAAVRSEFAPLLTVVTGAPDALPLLAGRRAGLAYLCRHGSCRLPAHTVDELRAQMAALRPAGRG